MGLERGVEHDGRRPPAVPLRARPPQTPRDVLDANDRVVDENADGNRQPRQHHHVERLAAQVQDEQGGRQRRQDRRDADQRGTPVPQERQEHQNHEQGPQEQRPAMLIDRPLDEGRRPEDGGVQSGPGKTGPQRAEFCFDRPGHVQRVAPGKLLHDEQEPGTAPEDGVPDQRLMAFHHLPQVTQAQGRTVALLSVGHGHSGQVGRR